MLDVPVGGRPLKVGDVICFELAYDRTVYDADAAGAQVSMVQSNNATYGGTGQIEQQFAITRARAMESRREIAVATTNSVSGFIDRDGRVVHRTARVHRRRPGGDHAAAIGADPGRPTVAPWLDRRAGRARCWRSRSAVRGGVGPVREDGPPARAGSSRAPPDPSPTKENVALSEPTADHGVRRTGGSW